MEQVEEQLEVARQNICVNEREQSETVRLLEAEIKRVQDFLKVEVLKVNGAERLRVWTGDK